VRHEPREEHAGRRRSCTHAKQDTRAALGLASALAAIAWATSTGLTVRLDSADCDAGFMSISALQAGSRPQG
jgi:hypothetical protein